MIDVYREMVRLKTQGETGVSITVVEKEGHGPAVPGSKMVVTADGKHIGTVGGGSLELAAIKQAENILNTRENILKKYVLNPSNQLVETGDEPTGMLCGGRVSMFFEYIGSGPHLYLFGAGHVGRALAYHLKPLDYRITLLDSREGMAESVDGPQHKLRVDYPTALHDIAVTKKAFFLVAAHSHECDYIILKRIYEAGWDPEYIGVLASRRKRDTMVERLRKELGENIDLNILYQPVGLDIGGPAPHEIAISVIAEMQAIRYGKTGNKHMKIR